MQLPSLGLVQKGAARRIPSPWCCAPAGKQDEREAEQPLLSQGEGSATTSPPAGRLVTAPAGLAVGGLQSTENFRRLLPRLPAHVQKDWMEPTEGTNPVFTVQGRNALPRVSQQSNIWLVGCLQSCFQQQG